MPLWDECRCLAILNLSMANVLEDQWRSDCLRFHRVVLAVSLFDGVEQREIETPLTTTTTTAHIALVTRYNAILLLIYYFFLRDQVERSPNSPENVPVTLGRTDCLDLFLLLQGSLVGGILGVQSGGLLYHQILCSKIISIKSLEIHDFCQSCEIGFFLTELYVDIYFLARLKKKEKDCFFLLAESG